MLHSTFKEVSPLVPEKRFYRGFTIYGRGGNSDHVTNIILIIFQLLVSKRLHTKFG